MRQTQRENIRGGLVLGLVNLVWMTQSEARWTMKDLCIVLCGWTTNVTSLLSLWPNALKQVYQMFSHSIHFRDL